MKKHYLGNAFSLNMLVAGEARLHVRQLAVTDVPADAESVVGHADTARIFAGQLGRDVPVARKTLQLGVGDVLYVGQYSGPRLPEGATELPAGAKIAWMSVTVE